MHIHWVADCSLQRVRQLKTVAQGVYRLQEGRLEVDSDVDIAEGARLRERPQQIRQSDFGALGKSRAQLRHDSRARFRRRLEIAQLLYAWHRWSIPL